MNKYRKRTYILICLILFIIIFSYLWFTDHGAQMSRKDWLGIVLIEIVAQLGIFYMEKDETL